MIDRVKFLPSQPADRAADLGHRWTGECLGRMHIPLFFSSSSDGSVLCLAAEQSIGSKMITNYIAGADAVLLCYDVTNYESFANLEDWYRLVLRTFQGKVLPYIALIGNKSTYLSFVFLLNLRVPDA